MRLGQLARKLELRPADIIQFLATQNIHLEDDTNTKIAEDYVDMITAKFAPGMQLENIREAEVDSVAAPPELDSKKAPEEMDGLPRPASSEGEVQEKTEVIKAQKVELSGLKVLGKIELPEPKKKQEESPQDNLQSDTQKEFKRDQRSPNYKKTQRLAKNPIALQREREAQAAQKKREEELQLKKEKRTQNYLKKVKPPQPTKAVKLVKEDTEDISSVDLAEPPKTWLGKLIRWLTT